MRTADVLHHFKTQTAVADALGIKQPSVASWGEYPPGVRQLQLEFLTGGALKAEPKWKLKAKPAPRKKARA